MATRQMQEPSPLEAASLASSRPTGRPQRTKRSVSPKFESTSTPTVCSPTTREDVPMPAGVAERLHAHAGADLALGDRAAGRACRARARRAPRPGSGPSRTSHHDDGSHSPTTGMITSSRPMRGWRAVSMCVTPA